MPGDLQGLSVSLPETARLILCDNEMLYTEAEMDATVLLLRPLSYFDQARCLRQKWILCAAGLRCVPCV